MDLFDIIAEFVLDLLEKITRSNITKRTQTVVDILVAFIFLLAVEGYVIWSAISYYRRGNMLGAVLFAAVVVVSVLLLGFFVIRRIIRKRKAKREP